jgi:hypothetical protein
VPEASSDQSGWLYGGIGAGAFATILGVGLFGFYDNHYILGSIFTAFGVLGLIAMATLLRGHHLTVVHVGVACLIATWVFLGYATWMSQGGAITRERLSNPDDIEKAVAPIRTEKDAALAQVATVTEENAKLKDENGKLKHEVEALQGKNESLSFGAYVNPLHELETKWKISKWLSDNKLVL